MQAIHTVFTEQLFDHWLSNTLNSQIEYQVTENGIKSEHMIALFGLCLHLNGNIQRKHYQQIESGELEVLQKDKQNSVYFLNKACYLCLEQISNDFQAKLFLFYFCGVLKNHDVKMMIKFNKDLNESTDIDIDSRYFLVFFSNQITQSQINNFKIAKFDIESLQILRKIQLIKKMYQDQLQNHKNQVVYHLKSQILRNDSSQISQISVSITISEFQLAQSRFSNYKNHKQKSDVLYIFGEKKYVKFHTGRIEKEIDNLIVKIYDKNGFQFSHQYFQQIMQMTQKYKKMSVFQDKNKMQVIYHKSIQKLFDENQMKYSNYSKLVKLDENSRKFIKTQIFQRIYQSSPNLLLLKNQTVLFGQNEIIKKIQKLQQKLNAKKQKSAVKPIYQNFRIQFLNNLRVNNQNCQKFLKFCNLYKVQYKMNWCIDVGEHLRIVNKIKGTHVLYLIFSTLQQIIQLQATIQQNFDIAEIVRVIGQYKSQNYVTSKILKSSNGNVTIKLYPSFSGSNMMLIGKEKQNYYIELLEKIRKDEDTNFRTILTTYSTLKQICLSTAIQYSLKISINEPSPSIDCPPLLSLQTSTIRKKMNRPQSEHIYYHEIKTSILNKQSLNSTLNTEQNKIRDIFAQNIHEYVVKDNKDHILNEIDQYNISYMIGQNIDGMFFTFAKKIVSQYVYLTYYQKLYKVCRNSWGEFFDIKQTNFNSKQFSFQNKTQLKSVLNRGFCIGQRYITINLPIQTIKYLHISQFQNLKQNNFLLLNHFHNKIIEGPRFKVQIKQIISKQQFVRIFSTYFQLKFNNKKIRSLLSQIQFGYGNVEKKKLKGYFYFKCKLHMCEKILDMIQKVLKE